MENDDRREPDGSHADSANGSPGAAPVHPTGWGTPEPQGPGGPADQDAVRSPDLRVPWRGVAVFTVVVLGLGWAACAPLWLSGLGLRDPQFMVWSLVMMYTPTIAALVVTLWLQRPRHVLRLLGVWPIRPLKRTIGFCVLALLGLCALPLLAMLLGGALGLVDLDLEHLSGMAQRFSGGLASSSGAPPLQLILIASIAALPVNSLISALATLGEEVGWRGWLLPNLRPLGMWPALLLTGVIWGVWHAPLILLGYNFGYTDLRGVGLMVVFCLFVGVLLGWLRLRTATIWPCVLGHAAINSASSVSVLLLSADALKDVHAMGIGSFLGVPGWILMAVVILVLLLTGQMRKEVRPGIPTGARAGAGQ